MYHAVTETGMWPIGHAAIAYLLYRFSTDRRFDAAPAAIPTVILGVGALFPDLVDKPFAWYLDILPTGRSLAHSLLVLVPLVVLVWLVARHYDRGEYGVAFGLGAISHALIDAVPVLWNSDATATFLLWPLLDIPQYEEGAPSILALLRDSMTEPYFLSEFLFLAIALVLWRADGYPGLSVLPGVTATADHNPET